LPQLSGHSLGSSPILIKHNNVRACARKSLRPPRSQSGRASSDRHDLSRHSKHGSNERSSICSDLAHCGLLETDLEAVLQPEYSRVNLSLFDKIPDTILGSS
jgi:hypothetical protein